MGTHGEDRLGRKKECLIKGDSNRKRTKLNWSFHIFASGLVLITHFTLDFSLMILNLITQFS